MAVGTAVDEMTNLHFLTPLIMSLLLIVLLLDLSMNIILIHSFVLILWTLLFLILLIASCPLLAGTFVAWTRLGMMLLFRRSRMKVRVRTMTQA